MRASEGLQAGISAPSSPSTTLGESNQETWNGTDFSSSKSTFINTFMRRKSLWLARIVVVQLITHVRLFVTPWTATHQASCPSLSPGVCSNSCHLSRWCHHPTISSSVTPFFSCPQSFPASVFSSESALHIRWPNIRELQLQHQTFQRIFRVKKATSLPFSVSFPTFYTPHLIGNIS